MGILLNASKEAFQILSENLRLPLLKGMHVNCKNRRFCLFLCQIIQGFHLICQEGTNNLDWLLDPIDVFSEKEVVCIWRKAAFV